ncbi:hypothetical protein ABZ281_28140 [Streptomyces sp. NPDC006265]|uniref:hypothetical protein n=1 Tax=Streptomyces sp. NPDC006265 TaxID=3156740 RepID=UPI0033B86BB0
MLKPFWTIVVVRREDRESDPIVISGRQESPRDLFEQMRYMRELPGVDMGLGEESSRVDLYENYEVLTAFKGTPQRVSAPKYEEEAAEEWSEHDECEAMAKELVRRGLKAENVSMGGGCYAVHIRLNDKDALYVTTWPDWSWSLEREGEQILSGHWSTSDIKRAAKGVKKLVKGLGEIVA